MFHRVSLGRHWFALAIASSEPQIEAVDPFAQTEVGSRETLISLLDWHQFCWKRRYIWSCGGEFVKKPSSPHSTSATHCPAGRGLQFWPNGPMQRWFNSIQILKYSFTSILDKGSLLKFWRFLCPLGAQVRHCPLQMCCLVLRTAPWGINTVLPILMQMRAKNMISKMRRRRRLGRTLSDPTRAFHCPLSPR